MNRRSVLGLLCASTFGMALVGCGKTKPLSEAERDQLGKRAARRAIERDKRCSEATRQGKVSRDCGRPFP